MSNKMKIYHHNQAAKITQQIKADLDKFKIPYSDLDGIIVLGSQKLKTSLPIYMSSQRLNSLPVFARFVYVGPNIFEKIVHWFRKLIGVKNDSHGFETTKITQ